MYVFGAIIIGFVSAVLAGMFGIGGAGTNTPAIRVILDAPPGIALGTTLPVTIPTAAAGAYTYNRSGFIVWRTAVFCCIGGILGSVGGALLTWVLNLHYLMLVTGGVILYVAAVTARRGVTGRGLQTEPLETPAAAAELAGSAPDAYAADEPEAEGVRTSAALAIAVGLVSGLFSGLLGIGGGIVLIPAFIYLLRMPLKTAFGTSLAVITVIAIPGTVVHSLLHHISWSLVLYLVIGSIPGAVLGARISIRSAERLLYVLFSILLAAFGIVFIVNEIISMV